MTIDIMRKQTTESPTLAELLRDALNNAKSVRAVARATGVEQASLVRFRTGQRTLHLDKADILAAYFGIESRQTKRKG